MGLATVPFIPSNSYFIIRGVKVFAETGDNISCSCEMMSVVSSAVLFVPAGFRLYFTPK